MSQVEDEVGRREMSDKIRALPARVVTVSVRPARQLITCLSGVFVTWRVMGGPLAPFDPSLEPGAQPTSTQRPASPPPELAIVWLGLFVTVSTNSNPKLRSSLMLP